MLEIEKPRIECIEEENGSYAKFILEPLEKGFGTTIGNALRRMLLSSLPGAAVTCIKLRACNMNSLQSRVVKRMLPKLS